MVDRRPENMIRQFDPAVQGDPLAWVISINLKRRHLDESQRAMVAANIANLGLGANQFGSANLRTLSAPPVSQAIAAKMLNVSERSVANAAVVRDKAEPELKHAVEQGHLAVSVASAAAKLPAEDQREIAAKAKAGEVNAARKVAKQKARKQKEKQLGAKQMALPDKKYGVIYADPEWKFETWSALGHPNG
jgi:hypothetical protein